MEEKDKAKEEIEGKNNEIQQLSLQQVDFIDHLTNASKDIMNQRLENERLQNYLNTKKKTNTNVETSSRHESVESEKSIQIERQRRNKIHRGR